jgi:nitrate/nitrite sensing protein/histidine kinase/DNA gyrase B/HSP90-like ATPase/HAMP domain-containing protein
VAKRPKEGRVPRSGARSLIGYLRDRPIGIKLGFIMFVPTLAIVIVGANGLLGQISTTNSADRARTLSTLTQYSGELVDQLQTERADATMLLGSTGAAGTAAGKVYTAQEAQTDAASTLYTRQSGSQANLPANFQALLLRIQSQIVNLSGLRTEVSNMDQIPLTIAVSQYTTLISSLLQIRDNASQLAGDSTLSFEMRAAAAIASNKEYLSQERSLVLEAILQKSIPPDLRRQLIATETGQDQAGAAFQVVATPAQLVFYDLQVAGNSLRPSKIEESYIDAGQSDALPSGLDATSWDRDMATRGHLLRLVEVNIDDETVSNATTLRNNVQKQIIVDVGLLFGMVLIAMLIAWFVARSMNRSLRELKQGALNVAQNGLPQAVARLRDPALSTQLSPHQIALQIAEPLPVRSRDEFGQVTEAFNAVHLEAVRTAAEQAALRSSVATMFVNLARRSQILVDRLIGHLDQLERGEENPDRLSELFQLDHLATRMRRNDENLLVLAGADSTRVQREPASLIDVLRAAQSEVEHYTRVEFGMIDRDIEVAAHAVNDVVHLVAELFDNATAFSPPDAVVLVEARRIGDRAVLFVEDRGIGVSLEQLAELNERLATPPIVDVAVSRMMGLVVVARLAYRHGVKVELRPGPERGIIADVLLPTTVLVSRALSGRASGNPALAAEVNRAAQAAPHALPVPPPRSPFGPPLALESGPSAGDRDNRGERSNAGDRSDRSNGVDRSSGNGSDRGSERNNGNSRTPVGANGYGAPVPAPSLGGFAANADAFDASARELLAGTNANRALPSWSDLTGSPEAPSPNLAQEMFGARNALPAAPPLPQRRAPDAWSEDARTDEADADPRPSIPRQRPSVSVPLDEARLLEEFADGEMLDDPYAEPSRAYVSEAAPPTAAPPLWPPVAAPQSSVREDTGQLQLGTGALQAAMDMTTEIPRLRELDLAGAAGGESYPDQRDTYRADAYSADPYGGGTYDADAYGRDTYERDSYDRVEPELTEPSTVGRPSGLAQFADETMELPIFRELESAWFRDIDTNARASAMTTDGDPNQSVDQLAAESGVRLPTGGATRVPRSDVASEEDLDSAAADTEMDGTPMTTSAGRTPSSGWRSAADDGWEAAAAAIDPVDGGTTDGGLPRRVPMAQLVPGGVDKAAAGSNRRSPDAVRGLLSAYHRGVQRGRQQSDEMNATSESTTGSTQSGGREQEA